MRDSGEGDDIIRTIVALATSLHLSVIAGGVESKSHLENLRSLGCQMGQGYFFARPLDAAAAQLYLLSKWRIDAIPREFSVPTSHDIKHESVRARV